MMTNISHLDVERQIHDLLSGGLSETERYEVLTLISHEPAAQALLKKMIREQEQVRAAFGLDHLDEIIPAYQQEFQASLSSGKDIKAGKGRGRQLKWLAWAAGIAVVVTMMSMIYMENRRGVALQRQMAQLTHVPSVKITDEDISRYRQIWSQVAEGSGTWVLVNNGNGEFGNIEGNLPSAGNSHVLLVQCRIMDESDHCLFTADVLLPDQPMTRAELPNVGQVAGRPASLTLTRSGEQTVASFLIRDNQPLPLGVTGHIPMSETKQTNELGRFRINNQTVKVFMRIQRLSGFRT